MKYRKYFFLLLFFFVFESKSDNILKNIEESLKKKLPDLDVSQINSFPIPGIYEVVSGNKVFYTDASGQYLILGNIVDLSNKESLTEKKIKEISRVNFKELPFSLALKVVKGNGKNQIAIFTDPDCPFCQNMEKNIIPHLDDVTIYYFILPLPIHKNSLQDAQKIFCSQNPVETYLSFMKDDVNLPSNVKCISAKNIVLIQDLAIKKLNIQATPTFIFENGKLLSGLPPLDYLNSLILSSQDKK